MTAADARLREVEKNLREAEKRKAKAESDLREAELKMDHEKANAVARLNALKAVKDAETLGTWASELVSGAASDGGNAPAHLLNAGERPAADDVAVLKTETKTLGGADEEKRGLDEARRGADRLDGEIQAQEGMIGAADAEMEPRGDDGQRLAAVRACLREKRREAAQAVRAEEEQAFGATPASSASMDERRAAGGAAVQRVKELSAAPLRTARDEQKNLTNEEATTRKRSQTAAEGAKRLTELMEEYDDLLERHDHTARQHLIHDTLARHLSERNLPARLRAEAENAIIANADVILQRLSGGSLCVERRADSGEALDIQVWDREKTDRPLRPAALSGSQRFRLAVALALGIGQYACGSHAGGVESVIVDEGFGSLDREGREKMIEELNRLGGILKRVIVVSHQDEFENAFANQWRIALEDGTARATLYP